MQLRGNIVLAGAKREPDQFQYKATQSQFPSLSVSLPSNISAAVMLLRKRKSESHFTAYKSYDACNASIQQGAPETCSPLISLSQEASEISQNFKQAEYVGQRSLSINSSSRSPMHEEIKGLVHQASTRMQRSNNFISPRKCGQYSSPARVHSHFVTKIEMQCFYAFLPRIWSK